MRESRMSGSVEGADREVGPYSNERGGNDPCCTVRFVLGGSPYCGAASAAAPRLLGGSPLTAAC
jgi:hypothetical protein